MTYSHPDRATLERFMRGELPVFENRRVLTHLMRGCRRCRLVTAELWPVHSGASANGSEELPDYADNFERILARARREEACLAEERAQAPRLFETLERQPRPRQLLLIRNSRRFRTWGLCELVLDRSRDAGFDDPSRAVRLAELALEIARRLEAEEYGGRLRADLEARAWMVLANARRIASDLSGSERAFRIAHSLLAEGTGDPLEEARLCSMKAVLRSDQRRFPEACNLLDQSVGIYRRLGQKRSLGQTLIRKGTALGEAGEATQAIPLLREGVLLLDAEQDRRWILAGKHNLVLYLSEQGDVEEALRLLDQARPLYAQLGESLNLVRLRWLEGRLALAQGHVAEAETALVEVRGSFVERAMGFDAALVTLDLAAVYLTRGRTAEIKQLAAEMLPIFEALEVYREAIAALVVFRRAVELEQVTVRLIQEVSGFLEKSRHDPRLRFQYPPC